MKRSEINQIIREAKEFLASRQFVLPEWAEWSLADWKANRDKVDYIVERMLGWDITDFGSGDFKRCGLFLFTIRNGKYGVDKKPYAEKIMIVEPFASEVIDVQVEFCLHLVVSQFVHYLGGEHRLVERADDFEVDGLCLVGKEGEVYAVVPAHFFVDVEQVHDDAVQDGASL